MSAARRRTPGTRRAELIHAAQGLFATQGVANTTVSDIVRAADAAQGTFYLYFESKNALVNAIVEHTTDHVIESIEAVLSDSDASAIEKLSAMAEAFVEMADEPHEIELLTLFHQPENMAFHDQFARDLIRRVSPLLARVIEQGQQEGVFTSRLDPLISASFIVGCLQSVESDALGLDDTQAFVDALLRFALNGLGYHSAIE